MKTHEKQPQQRSRTLDCNPKAANQASWEVIMQRYAEQTKQLYSIEEDDELLQKKSDTVQRQELPEDEELLQGKFEDTTHLNAEKKPNNTGLPDDLKEGVENLSGYSMDGVRVHYNSDKPAQLSALAYAQGTDIHISPGQEKHLPHEAWHVVQQKQGRVQPTMQMQGVNVNDNEVLEKEADLIYKEIYQNNSLQKKHNININLQSNSTRQLIAGLYVEQVNSVEKLKEFLNLLNTEGLSELLTHLQNNDREFNDKIELRNYCADLLRDIKKSSAFTPTMSKIETYRGDNRLPQKLLADNGFSWFDSSKNIDPDRIDLENRQKSYSQIFIEEFPKLSNQWIFPGNIVSYDVFNKIFPLNKLNDISFLKINVEYSSIKDEDDINKRYIKFRDLHLSDEKLRVIRGPMAGVSTSTDAGQYGSNAYKINVPDGIVFNLIKSQPIGLKAAIYETNDKHHRIQVLISSTYKEIDFLTPVPPEWIYYLRNGWKLLTKYYFNERIEQDAIKARCYDFWN